MSGANSLGREEIAIGEKWASCMALASPVIFVVAAHFVRSSWRAITGAEDPIISSPKALNIVVGLAILGVSLLFCVCAVILLIGGLWKTQMKFYERGISLHGAGAFGPKTRFLYGDVESARITEKHNTVDAPAPRYQHQRGLLVMAVEALLKMKPEKRPQVYENTEYTFSFKLKGEEAPAEFTITLHRDDGEVAAVVERLEAEGVKAERVEAREES